MLNDNPPVQKSGEPSATALLIAISAGPFIGILNAISLAPFLPVIADELNVSVALVGQIPAATMLLAAFLGLITGPMADFMGQRRMLLVGLGAIVVAALGTAFSISLVTLLLAALCGAVSRSIVVPIAYTIAGVRLVAANRRTAIGLISAATSGAGIIGVPFLTGIDAAFGWRMAFVALGGLGIANLLYAALVVRPDPPRTTTGGFRMSTILNAYPPLLRHRPTRGLMMAALARGIGLWLPGTYMMAYLITEYGLTTQQAGWSYTAFGLGMLCGGLLSSGPLHRLPPRPLITASSAFSGFFLFIAMGFHLQPVAIIALVFVGYLVNGLGNVASTTLLLEEAPGGRGTTMTLNTAMYSLASAFGASLGGLLLVLGGYSAIGMAIPFFGLVSSALVWFSRPRTIGDTITLPETT